VSHEKQRIQNSTVHRSGRQVTSQPSAMGNGNGSTQTSLEVEMSLATTVEESKANRRNHILDALHYRRHNLRKAKRVALSLASVERLNQRFFLGEPPF
jgi:hypothetical protein